MPKTSQRPMPDAENPEWTPEKFARAKRLDQLPEALQRVLGRGMRGPQKAPTKTLIGCTYLGQGSVNGTSGTASLTTSLSGAGQHTVYAVYRGDVNFFHNNANAVSVTVQ